MGQISYLGFFFVLITQAMSQPVKIEENIQNLFDSIAKNDSKKIETQYNILSKEAIREQQAFDDINSQRQLIQRRNNNNYKNINTIDVFRRDTQSIKDTSSHQQSVKQSITSPVRFALDEIGFIGKDPTSNLE